MALLPPPKVTTPTADDIEQQLRLKGIGRVLRRLGLMRLEDTEDIGLSNLKVKMGQAPQEVLGGLRRIGRNPDSETFLKSLKPDVDEGGLNTIFGSPPALATGGTPPAAPPVTPMPVPPPPPPPPVEPPPPPPQSTGTIAPPSPERRPITEIRPWMRPTIQPTGLTTVQAQAQQKGELISPSSTGELWVRLIANKMTDEEWAGWQTKGFVILGKRFDLKGLADFAATLGLDPTMYVAMGPAKKGIEALAADVEKAAKKVAPAVRELAAREAPFVRELATGEAGMALPGKKVSKPITKATQYSIDKVENALKTIEDLVPKEAVRESQVRRRQLVAAYASLDLHADKLGIIRPKLGTYYRPEEYLGNARQMAMKVTETYKSKARLPTETKPPAPSGVASQPAKEPWQMTRVEYRADVRTSAEGMMSPRATKTGFGKAQPLRKADIERMSTTGADEAHRFRVKQALSEGKPVPTEVLKDYPDLARATPKAEPSGTVPPELPKGVAPPPSEPPKPPEPPAGAKPPTAGTGGKPPPLEPPPAEPPADLVPPPAEPPIDIIPPPTTPAPGERIIGDLQGADELVTTMTEPDVFRKLAKLPGLKSVLKYLNPAGVAESPAAKAVIARAALREEGQNKAIGAFSTLEQLGKRADVWGKTDDAGRITSGNLEGKLLDEVLTFRTKYAPDMTPQQKAWADQFHAIERDKLDFLKRNGISINELSFEEGGEYVGRRVAGRLDDTGNLVDSAFIGSPGPGRPGSKMGAEKTRQFKDINEAVEQGYRYLPSDEALFLNIKGAYNRVADKQMADWVLERIPVRTTEVFSLPKASALVRDALKRQPIKESRLVALRRDMPEFATKIEDALKISDWTQRYAALQSIRQELKQVIPTSQAKLFWAVERLAKNRKTVEEGIAAMQRALRGETLPTGTIRAIENVVPQLKGKLRDTTRITLDDLVRSGREAAEYPKILEVPHPGVLAKYRKLLKEAQDKLAANPKDAQLAKEVRQLKAKIGFTKYRMAKGEPLALSKSPKSILAKEHKKAIEEALNVLRGEGYETITATGKKTTKYRGGILKEIRQEELKAIESRKEVAESARTAHLGEASVQAPVFAGKILTGKEARETAEILSRAFNAQYGDLDRILMSVNKVNAIGRYFMLAGDASALTIQLIGFSVRFPRIWSKSAVSFTKALFSEKSQAAYLAKNNAIIQKSRNLILTKGGQTEYTEAFRSGGLFSRGPAKLLQPFQRGFEASMDTAGVELRKALDHLADTPQHAAEVEQFINEFRGVTSSARIGVSPQLRQFETAVFLAPRYNRAVAALLSDVARGGIRGDQARKAVLALIGGSAALAIAVTLALDEGWEAIVDHLNPQSTKFMTWEIAGQRIGPGSKFRSLMALAGKITKEPERTVELIANFVRAQFSPLLSTSIDIINGRDYVGEPTRPGKPLGFGKEVGFVEGMLGLSRRVIADNLLPLSLNSFLMEGGDFAGRISRGAAEFAGGRAYPSRTDEAKDVIDKAFIQLGKEDTVGLEAALKGVTNSKKIADIRAKDHVYDITSLRRDISDAIRYIEPKDITEKNGFNPLAMVYADFDKVDDEYEALSIKEREQFVKNNPDYITDRLFWGELTTIPDLKTAEALAAKAKKYGFDLDMIPAFQLTDKGKERIPSKRDLWQPYFDYNDLPSSSYLNFTKEQVDAGELPEKYRKDWEQFQKLKNDRAQTAFKKARNKKGGAAYGGWRDDFRRVNPEFDKWLQEHKELKPLSKVSGGRANRRAQTASSPFSGGFRPVSGGRRRLPLPKFPKARVSMGISAPRAPGV